VVEHTCFTYRWYSRTVEHLNTKFSMTALHCNDRSQSFPKLSHCSSGMHKARMLRVPERCQYKVAVLVYKVFHAGTRAAVSWHILLCYRLAWPPTSPFCWHQPSGSAAGQVDNRRQPGFPGCWPTELDRCAGRRDIRWVVVHVSSATQIAPFLEILFMTISWTLLHLTCV